MSLAGLELGNHLGQALVAKADTDSAPGKGPSVSIENLDAVLAEGDTNVTPGTGEIRPSQTVTEAPPTISTTQTSEKQIPESIPIPSAPTLWTIQDWIFIIVALALWLGVVFAAIWMPTGSFQSWRHVALACCFAPLGAIVRWYMSRWNPKGLKRFQFPVGTFAANILGSMVLAAVICLQHSTAIREHSGAAAACQVFSGLQDGFCGRCFDFHCSMPDTFLLTSLRFASCQLLIRLFDDHFHFHTRAEDTASQSFLHLWNYFRCCRSAGSSRHRG